MISALTQYRPQSDGFFSRLQAWFNEMLPKE